MKSLNRLFFIVVVIMLVGLLAMPGLAVDDFSGDEPGAGGAEQFGQQVAPDVEEEYLRGRIVDLTTEENPDEYLSLRQMLEVEVTSGEFSGEVITAEHAVMENNIYGDERLEEGKRIILQAYTGDGEIVEAYFHDLARERGLIYLGIITLLVLIVVARKQGLKTIITLILTLGLIFFYLIPALAEGAAPIPTAVASSIVMIIIIHGIIGGWRLKSLIAILGTVTGVLLAGLLAYGFGQLVNLTGLNNEEARLLIGTGLDLNPKGILFAGIIIGSLGAVTDVAMSIASFAENTWKNDREISARKLYNIGIATGKDIIGTMANTLILAYVGSSLALLILFYHFSGGWIDLINFDLVATEIVRGLAGTAGLIVTIPVTALLASFFYTSR
ncbi:YibE/F family protein [Halanaerobiaceae bacterium Z-7014]|uniref:YibE/F family protein n=1 Tax=Halonatronomonas betaini TaxID=2778430 RepID=A0A931AYM7_9FIRM|nr:YibE/F family protein [Halonatronomonas betaini]MBF8437213.1 YibE/F family protein [Halonatronomonas betaini]